LKTGHFFILSLPTSLCLLLVHSEPWFLAFTLHIENCPLKGQYFFIPPFFPPLVRSGPWSCPLPPYIHVFFFFTKPSHLSTLKMDITASSKTSILFWQTTWHHIPENSNLHTHKPQEPQISQYCLCACSPHCVITCMNFLISTGHTFMEQSSYCEGDSHPDTQRNSQDFMKTKRSSVFTRTHHWTLPWTRWIQSTPYRPPFLRSILILLFSLKARSV
jgi:hypothetical protein